ncbi:hypothetical protein Tsubulata_026524 [Turnera subulata]|uniref:Uncharacterized protein n=1 Tax=Turnera subulata TaxID=218843 RepID=A0A9Q0FQK3_9ROSI|nr:hypothetical protein Tsubulata_026524 [Turnera subulata]
MEPTKKLELIDQAIHKLLAEERNKKASGGDPSLEDDDDDDDTDQRLLSRLLSELESLKGDQYDPSAEREVVDSPAVGAAELENEKSSEVVGGGGGGSRTEIGAEEIVKELKKVKKQNLVTHCLLSVMILLTVTWQLSEVSLLLKVKDGLSHPFRSFGGLLAGMVLGPGRRRAEDNGNNGNNGNHQNGALTVAGAASSLRMPELPALDFNLNGDQT